MAIKENQKKEQGRDWAPVTFYPIRTDNHPYRPEKLFQILWMAILLAPSLSMAAAPKECPPPLEADSPVVPLSIEQQAINNGNLDFEEIVAHGGVLFNARFNTCDGQGRPATTGGGEKRAVPTFSEEGEALSAGQVTKIRTSSPDSDSCSGCHNAPEAGGAGDFVANVFVLAQTLDPVTLSVSPGRSNSRNTLGMHGAGPIEMLAREMTVDLQAQFDNVKMTNGKHTLTTKGVEFEIDVKGRRVVHAQGIDHDLIVKPFHQAGRVISIREFTNNAMNHHHGMQAEERFDLIKGADFDEDGINRELTIGDQTAITIWQAQLSTPVQVLPEDEDDLAEVLNGESRFDEAGCTSCHIPELVLNNRDFIEPNPFNPAGNCASPHDGCPDFSFDMTSQGQGHRLEKGPNKTAIVRAYTDLKRHNLCDDDSNDPEAIRWFCNETLSQGRPDQDGKPGTEFFLTRKLWDVGNTAPYGHRGDLSTITEAILVHGGEARESRDAFVALDIEDQKALVAFLKTLQVVPLQEFKKGGKRVGKPNTTGD